MINIVYAPQDAKLAEQFRRDLSAANVSLDNDFLIVLISPEANADTAIQNTIDEALSKGLKVAPVIVRSAPLPSALKGVSSFKQTRGYNRNNLVAFIKYQDRSDELNASNRGALLVLGSLMVILFLAASFLVGGGVVRFPREEYNNLETFEAATINALIRPTLEGWQPRTTQDAIDFSSTAQSAPTRIRPFLVATATALAPHERQIR